MIIERAIIFYWDDIKDLIDTVPEDVNSLIKELIELEPLSNYFITKARIIESANGKIGAISFFLEEEDDEQE